MFTGIDFLFQSSVFAYFLGVRFGGDDIYRIRVVVPDVAVC